MTKIRLWRPREQTRPDGDGVPALARQIDLLRERRQALITAAVTGQLDISRRRHDFDHREAAGG